MKFMLLAALVLVIIILYFLYPLLRAVRISKSIEQHTVAYEQYPTNAALRILVAGDSTGVGTGASKPEESIAGRIGSDFPTSDIRNISENGLTLAGLKGKLDAETDTHYDLIVLQIGANDVTKMTSYKDVRSTLNDVLDYAEKHATSTVVLSAGDVGAAPAFKYPLSAYITQRTLKVRSIFQSEVGSRSSMTYVDLYADRAHNVFNTDIEKYYAPDHFHPSSSGYGEWYTKVGPAVRLSLIQTEN